MAIIDLRHLIEPEYDTVTIIGSDDKKEYSIPIKKNMGISLMMTQYFSDYMKNKIPDEPDAITNIELNYRMVTALIRGYYPELSLEWVKLNICEELFVELVRMIEPLFFPKQTETGQPKKNRKHRLS